MDFLVNSPAGALLDRVDRPYVYCAATALLVCALVVTVFLLSSRKQKLDHNSGIFTYVKFVYATFLKPHDKGGESQQDALESFYKTQVRTAPGVACKGLLID